MEEKKFSYYCEFINGYAFRTLIDVIKPNFTETVFEFTEDTIKLRDKDTSDSMLIDFCIKSNEIGNNYIYNSKKPIERAGINVHNLRSTTSSISKKDGYKLFKYENERNLNAQKLSNKKGSSNICDFIRLIDIDHSVMPDLPTFGKPNCIIPTSDFCEMCKSMTNMKFSDVIITGYPYGISFECKDISDISGRKTVFGDCMTEENCEKKLEYSNSMKTNPNAEIGKIKIKLTILKSLSKINNLGNSVQVFIEKDLPIMFKVTGFGTTCFYLKNNDNE